MGWENCWLNNDNCGNFVAEKYFPSSLPVKEELNLFFPSLASAAENEIDVEAIAKTRRPTRPTRPPKPAAMSAAASTSTYFPPDKEKNNYLLRPTKPWVKISGLATTPPATTTSPSTR